MRIGIVYGAQAAAARMRGHIEQRTPYQVAWMAHDCEQALELCGLDEPDLLLLDVVLPQSDRVVNHSPCPILIVTASVSAASGKVCQAFAAGALDAVDTPTSSSVEEFVGKLEMLAKGLGLHPTLAQLAPAPCPLIVIGSSAGGPAALAALLAGLPGDLCASLAIVQHIDAGYTPDLASWLDAQTPLQVSVAKGGDRPAPGKVLLAGQSAHLEATPEGTLTYVANQGGHIHCPSVDVFFHSVAEHWAGPCVGVLLTGMGRDGARGLLTLRKRGHHTIAQNQETSAIFGMPMAAIEIGAACEVLALQEIPQVLQLGLTGHFRTTEHVKGELT